MLCNVHVGQLMANPKVIQKTFSFCEIMWAAIGLLATSQQANISIKVQFFNLGLSIFFKIMNILSKGEFKSIYKIIQLYYICKLY